MVLRAIHHSIHSYLPNQSKRTFWNMRKWEEKKGIADVIPVRLSTSLLLGGSSLPRSHRTSESE